MNDSQFDTWTRRRLGLAVGAGVAAALGLDQRENAAARKKKRCRRVEQPCGNKKSCCKQLTCDVRAIGESRFCCRETQQVCAPDGQECCRNLLCGEISGLSGDRCCAPGGVACETDDDCCIGDVCTPSGTCGD